jgi:hypothetical protein
MKFLSAYGYEIEGTPQIHGLLLELRRQVGSLAAKKQAGGPMFPVRGAKELNQKLAQALNDLSMMAPVIAQEVTFIDTDKIPANINDKGRPTFRTLVHVTAKVRIIAPDGSYLDVVGSGHGGDTDDKAGGKASTYAWKDAILKGLSIPHEDMVDTDDDASPPGATSAIRSAPVAAPAPADSVSTVDALGLFKGQLAAAKTMNELEAVKQAVVDNKIGLVGSERLEASKLWSEAKLALIKTLG